IRGSGLTVTTADFKLDGNINRIGIKGYDYTNIKTNARFASEFFNGLVSIDDPNLQFGAEGSIDLRQGVNEIKVKANIDTAMFQNLKLTDRQLFLRADMNLNLKGLHLDSIVGTADIKDLHVINDGKSLSLDSIQLISHQEDQDRSIRIQSSLVDGEVNGDFLLTDLTQDLQTLVREILLNIRNDEQAITSYYEQKDREPKSYETDFQLMIKNLQPVTALFNLDLLVSKNTMIQGKFMSGYTSILQAYSMIDSLA